MSEEQYQHAIGRPMINQPIKFDAHCPSRAKNLGISYSEISDVPGSAPGSPHAARVIGLAM